MGYYLNSTADYHINELNSLGWELTVCNSLYPEKSPCRYVLLSQEPFGTQLYKYLEKFIPLKDFCNILEIGGGLGYLMHDFLSANRHLKATMLDISPHLLEKQKECLLKFDVNYLQNDALKMDISSLAAFDFVIMNENLGDLPTLVAHPESKPASAEESSYIEGASYFREKYQMPWTQNENINIGALEILEKLCQAGVKYIYLSEHSCEATVPENIKSFIRVDSSGNPEKISLAGHNEYTIKFSCLQRIAETFNYKVVRGPFADFLQLDFNDKVRTALQLVAPHTDEQEIIRQFVYDLYKYEYLVLIKGGRNENE